MLGDALLISLWHRRLIATIGDEDTITGVLLAGTGQLAAGSGKKNFLIVDNSKSKLTLFSFDLDSGVAIETSTSTVESTFQEFTERSDIAIILINQHVAEMIRPTMEAYTLPFPAILEIPSKDHPYDPSKDACVLLVPHYAIEN